MTPAEVGALIAEVLGIDPSRIRGDLAFGEVPEWDSLHHVNLMIALEDRLGVVIGPEQLVELTTVTLIEQFAAAHEPLGAEPPSTGS
ncbi:MAG: acyl carrier protein [Solirubrobacteraceae bacterium]|jgi:citrate synthase